MSIVKMSGLTFVGPRKEIEILATRLLVRGDFQPLSIDSSLDDLSIRSRIKTFRANPYDPILEDLESIWRTAGEELPVPSVSKDLKFRPFEELSARVSRASKRLRIWEKRARQLAREEEELEAAVLFAEVILSLGDKGRQALNSRIVKFFLGRFTRENFGRLEDSVKEVPMMVIPVRQSGEDIWAVVITVSGYLEGALKLLESVYFREFPIAETLKGLGPDWVGGLRRRIENHKRARSRLEEAARNYLNRSREELEDLYYQVYGMQRIYALCMARGQIGEMFILSGWLPSEEIEGVKTIMAEEAPGTMIIVESSMEKAREGRKIPVRLKNLPFVRNFQDIVALYSLPSYGESDPSLLVALSFCFFFGFMFGDVGHGIMLIVGAMILEKKNLVQRAFASVIKLSGLSASIFGFLYGSIFGNEHILHRVWISPMEDMGELIQTSLAAGIVFISIGMIMNIFLRYRKREYGKLLFDGQGLAGLVFYWIAVVFAWSALSNRKLPVPSGILLSALLILFIVILLAEVLSVRLLHEKHGEASNVVHVFEVFHTLLSFLSNTASFVRLAAFALNHVGLCLAVMMLGQMVEGLPGGGFIKWIILIVGHLVIVALEGLIVFIQTLRLEYYEFFSKFYSGGGKAFVPMKWGKK